MAAWLGIGLVMLNHQQIIRTETRKIDIFYVPLIINTLRKLFSTRYVCVSTYIHYSALTWIQFCRVSTEAYTGTAILSHVASILAAVGDACSVRIVRSATSIISHKRGEQSKYNYFQRNENQWEQQFLQLSSNFLPLRRFILIFLAHHC